MLGATRNTGHGRTGGRGKSWLQAALLLLSLLLSPLAAHAVNPDEILADPVLEERARGLSAQLRCMVCQNQSIDDSNAELARDLRLLVRDRIVKGETDEQVIDYVVSRYGEFVLLKPRFSTRTLLLWSAPVVLAVAGASAMFLFTRRRQKAGAIAKLSDEEEARLKALLDE
ncbi:cytochrome c-type biogenesis protein [Rhizobium sp. RU36D]|uniref:cytochrome c-type biogenesis protein n=1 Tax=Rhizobium sp. RU36D TaxID=1907415 RepID=UPI0009FC1234|nr:cytochrome c-type biogenesis protein [Rhizobium sp. RU36D]